MTFSVWINLNILNPSSCMAGRSRIEFDDDKSVDRKRDLSFSGSVILAAAAAAAAALSAMTRDASASTVAGELTVRTVRGTH